MVPNDLKDTDFLGILICSHRLKVACSMGKLTLDSNNRCLSFCFMRKAPNWSLWKISSSRGQSFNNIVLMVQMPERRKRNLSFCHHLNHHHPQRAPDFNLHCIPFKGTLWVSWRYWKREVTISLSLHNGLNDISYHSSISYKSYNILIQYLL